MASSHPSNVPGDRDNSASRAANNAQQRTPPFDATRHYQPSYQPTVEGVMRHVNDIAKENARLKESLYTLNSRLEQLIAAKPKKKQDVPSDENKGRLSESLQNYEDAKVVVLTYKTKNIRLEATVKKREAEIEKLQAQLKV